MPVLALFRPRGAAEWTPLGTAGVAPAGKNRFMDGMETRPKKETGMTAYEEIKSINDQIAALEVQILRFKDGGMTWGDLRRAHAATLRNVAEVLDEMRQEACAASPSRSQGLIDSGSQGLIGRLQTEWLNSLREPRTAEDALIETVARANSLADEVRKVKDAIAIDERCLKRMEASGLQHTSFYKSVSNSVETNREKLRQIEQREYVPETVGKWFTLSDFEHLRESVEKEQLEDEFSDEWGTTVGLDVQTAAPEKGVPGSGYTDSKYFRATGPDHVELSVDSTPYDFEVECTIPVTIRYRHADNGEGGETLYLVDSNPANIQEDITRPWERFVVDEHELEARLLELFHNARHATPEVSEAFNEWLWRNAEYRRGLEQGERNSGVRAPL